MQCFGSGHKNVFKPYQLTHNSNDIIIYSNQIVYSVPCFSVILSCYDVLTAFRSFLQIIKDCKNGIVKYKKKHTFERMFISLFPDVSLFCNWYVV